MTTAPPETAYRYWLRLNDLIISYLSISTASPSSSYFLHLDPSAFDLHPNSNSSNLTRIHTKPFVYESRVIPTSYTLSAPVLLPCRLRADSPLRAIRLIKRIIKLWLLFFIFFSTKLPNDYGLINVRNVNIVYTRNYFEYFFIFSSPAQITANCYFFASLFFSGFLFDS